MWLTLKNLTGFSSDCFFFASSPIPLPSSSFPHDGWLSCCVRVFLSCFRILAISLGRRPWYYTASRARPCTPGWNKGSRVVGLSPLLLGHARPRRPAMRLPYTHLPLTYIPSAITTCPESCNESINVRQIAAPPRPHTIRRPQRLTSPPLLTRLAHFLVHAATPSVLPFSHFVISRPNTCATGNAASHSDTCTSLINTLIKTLTTPSSNSSVGEN